MGVLPFLYDTLKLIRCWERAPVTTQLQKFDNAPVFPFVPSGCELLELKGQNEGKAQKVVSPLQLHQSVYKRLGSQGQLVVLGW